ncbi:MAG: hypothetical protein M1829_002856 [Trizodia sp. TS-e1964]|nr:MAG: hypothetical protein M1829_002856 [Trizodia sp. TS-e1964]
MDGDAQQRIAELESQVKILTGKATAAVDRLADYEDELRLLRSEKTPFAASSSEHPKDSSRPTSSSSATRGPVQNRLSAFLSSKKSTSNLKQPTTPTTPTTSDLQAALTREQTLRQQAEGKLNEASGELEELSAQLFQQANEMVATERKARAKLEERVVVLERRDVEKRKRLERLEGAVKRIERVRALLQPT